MYGCEQWIDGVMFYQAASSREEAIDKMFENLKWLNIGNWETSTDKLERLVKESKALRTILPLGHDSEEEMGESSYEPAQERNLPDGYHSRELE